MAIDRSSSVSLSVCPSVHPWMCPMERLTPPPHLVWLRNDGWWCFGSVVAYFVFEFCCREIFLCLFLFAVYAFIHKYGKRWTLNTEHWELYRKEMMAENKTNFFVANNRKILAVFVTRNYATLLLRDEVTHWDDMWLYNTTESLEECGHKYDITLQQSYNDSKFLYEIVS